MLVCGTLQSCCLMKRVLTASGEAGPEGGGHRPSLLGITTTFLRRLGKALHP